jgi:hypothetical protein
MVTPGLRGAGTAQRNAEGKTFCALAVLASRRKPVICLSWQIPFDVYVSPRVFLAAGQQPGDPPGCAKRHLLLVTADWLAKQKEEGLDFAEFYCTETTRSSRDRELDGNVVT